MNSIANVNVFVYVAREGSISGASKKLGLSPASISKRLKSFEEEVGVRLMNRTSRALRLTEEGRELYQKLLILLDDFEEATASVSCMGTDVQGTLRVAISSSLDHHLVSSLVAEFAEQNPRLKVEFDVCRERIDLLRQGYDVAILPGQPAQESLVARRLLAVNQILCAAPGYLAEHPAPTSPEGLLEHRCLVRECEGLPASRWTFGREGRWQTVDVAGCLITSNSDVLKGWVLKGQGIALMSEDEVRNELDYGVLVRVLEDYALAPLELYLAYAQRTHLPAKTRNFVEFILGRAEDGP